MKEKFVILFEYSIIVLTREKKMRNLCNENDKHKSFGVKTILLYGYL